MNPTQIGNMVEKIGIPAAMAAGGGFLIWWLLRWMTTDLGGRMGEIKQEIKTETDDVQAEVRQLKKDVQGEIKLLHNITIRLVDRVRVMERNQMASNVEMLTKLGCSLPDFTTTRAEQVAELEEKIKDVGARNGEISG